MTENTYIEYDDSEAITRALIGTRIVSAAASGIGTNHYDGVITVALDNGKLFIARESHGGCACSNGCFDLTMAERLPDGVITGAEVVETVEYGEIGAGGSTIRLFIYTGDEKTELFSSTGGDNGYYGWGYHLYVQFPEELDAPSQSLEIEAGGSE